MRCGLRIIDQIDTFLDNLIKLADGVKAERETPDGKTYAYTTPPDLRANTYLIDRVKGKPTERHQHDFSHLTDEELLERVALLVTTDGGLDDESMIG